MNEKSKHATNHPHHLQNIIKRISNWKKARMDINKKMLRKKSEIEKIINIERRRKPG